MEFKEYYSQNILDRINAEVENGQNKIFVILGQADLINDQTVIEHLTDSKTFNSLGNNEIFDQKWATSVFVELQKNKNFHILPYPQFSYLLTYFDKTLFGDRFVIIKDNLRQLFPISKEDYLEKSEAEHSIEKRPD